MSFKDVLAACSVLAAIGFFVQAPALSPALGDFMAGHQFLTSFLKFAVLCTLGECIALRVGQGVYLTENFGIAPRLLMWGVIGLCIHTAFTIFATGTPNLLGQLGIDVSGQPSFFGRLGLAFSISTTMNILFAPLFMTAHSVVASHIVSTGGTLRGFFSPLNVGEQLRNINWDMLWGFALKKTIPMFWIPAHTITFMLPVSLRILFAAALGIVLGIILALASQKGEPIEGGSLS
jgi:hypothetical protein